MKHVKFKDAGTIKVRFQEATTMKPRKIEVNDWKHRTTKVMCEAYQQMNSIRARDGTPRGSSVSRTYWDDIMSRLDNLILEETGKVAHCNPALYRD